jgi:hypothetical protein
MFSLSLTLTCQPPEIADVTTLERAILAALAYSDVFDYPLTGAELWKYLPVPASLEEIEECAARKNGVSFKEGYYYLSGRDEIVEVRMMREANSRRAFQRAMTYGKMLGRMPFVRMAALTGSLAMLNLHDNADLDYMLVTQPGRLWTARAFAVTFGRIMRPFGDVVCVNLLVSEDALAWDRRDLYTAREMVQMVPIAGMDVYHRLRAANLWTITFLPNAAAPLFEAAIENTQNIQRKIEFPFRGSMGERFEQWAMKFQWNIIARRSNGGGETRLSADVCQGNFHHHRRWTMEKYRARLAALGLEEPAKARP